MDRNTMTKSRGFLESSSGDGSKSGDEEQKPNPADFVAFLPWACVQLSIDAYVEITKINQSEYVSRVDTKQLKGKSKQFKKTLASDLNKDLTSSSFREFVQVSHEDESKVVRIGATYSGDHLVHIKIDKTKNLPRELVVILGLIIQFYPYLSSVTINSGVNKYTVYEMCLFLPFSNISEINMDDTFIAEANYYLILDNTKQLKTLSLSRCKLNDIVVEKIASKLEYPLPSSMTLSILNLSSNRLTDKSAKSLGKMLRTNRCLSYLNIAGNMITDNGIAEILNVLLKFPLTVEEMLIVRGKYLKYLKKRQELIDDYMKKLREAELENIKKKITKKPNTVSKKSSSNELLPQRSSVTLYSEFYEKALKMAKSVCGPFEDPLGKDTISANGLLYSNGNNTLAYLNIAYNNISQYTVNLLLDVVQHQKSLSRSPRGLVNVRLEGNPISEVTPELVEIDSILAAGLIKSGFAASSKRKSIMTVPPIVTKKK